MSLHIPRCKHPWPASPAATAVLRRWPWTWLAAWLVAFVAGTGHAAAPAMALDETRHLLARTGFGPGLARLRAYAALSYESAVERLLTEVRTQARTAPPAWVDEPPPDFRALRRMDQAQRKDFQKARRRRALELQGWWYSEMLYTDSPLTERMTLFWHNHFTSALRKVRWPALLYRQNVLLRRHALGNFRDLLHGVAKDPAMLLYLDNHTNRKGRPNENFARELLELFTLGEGHYTEQDIKAAARAFTGWRVNRKTGRFHFARRQHDSGYKEFLGRGGALGGEDILDILLQQPRVAEYITAKLWREFVSATPDPVEVRRLAALWRRHDYELRPLLRALLLAPQFRSPAQRGVLIKSPVELLVGTARHLQLSIDEPQHLVRLGRRMGQDIFNPPNVKGWPGHKAWINSATWPVRRQIIARVLRGREADSMPGFNDVDVMQVLLLPTAPVQAVSTDAAARRRLEQYLNDPVYQLK